MEGANGAYDAQPQPQRAFKEIPLTENQQTRVNERLAKITSDMEAAVAKLKKSTTTVGNRVAIGLTHGNPTTLEEALVNTGEALSGENGSRSGVVQSPDSPTYNPFHKVDDFGIGEIGRVHSDILEDKMKGNDPTNIRFIGTLEIQNDGWNLGVVDTLTNTMTTMHFNNSETTVPTQESVPQPA